MRDAAHICTPPDVHIRADPNRVHQELIAFALKQIRNQAWAEDAVSEAILAALARPEMFKGRAHAQTWLIGILKHKLADQVRLHDLSGEELHDECGTSSRPPEVQAVDELEQPQFVYERRQLLDALLECSRRLSHLQRSALLMKDWHDVPTTEICSALEITPANLFVLLHRARRQVRATLDRAFLDETSASGACVAAISPRSKTSAAKPVRRRRQPQANQLQRNFQ